MQDRIDELAKKLGLSRREFLKMTAQSGAVLGTAPFLSGCFNNSHSRSSDANKEKRTYYFDLSHTDEGDDHYLVLGSEVHKLHICNSQVIDKSGNPLLQSIPEGTITHHITHNFPSDSIQACHIRTIKPDDPKGVWSMSLSFFHLPSASVRRAALIGEGNLDTLEKLSYHGVDASVFAGTDIQDAYLYADAIKTFFDTAVDLTFHHPEILSGESDSAAHIQTNILGAQSTVKALGYVLQAQGSAKESGGWATLEPYLKDDGEPYLNSQGQKQHFPRYSDLTNTYLGGAVKPSLANVKNDLSLGVNITDLDPTVENPEMNGKIWKIYDGITTVEADQPSLSSGFLTCPNKSRRHGYKATFISENSGTVTFKVENWFLRYLGIYVQFLDSTGAKIKLDDLPSTTLNSFPYPPSDHLDSPHSKLATFIAGEWEVLGIPIKHQTAEISFVWPEVASSAKIIAGGFGFNANEDTDDVDYAQNIIPGGCLTTIVHLAVPGLFLAYAAGGAYKVFSQTLSEWKESEMVSFALGIMLEFGVDVATAITARDPKVLIELGKTIGELLLKKGVAWPFTRELQEAIDAGEVLDEVPVIGKILAAASTVALASELAQTIGEMSASPAAYVDDLTAAHDIEVTIYHDPDDTAGFPAVADYYILTAMFDNGTPHSSGRIDMPGTTVTDPLYYTFTGVPYGGKVKVCVGFYADKDNWLAGKGCTDNFTNDVDSAEITIKEIKVPLNSDTVYGHKQKIVLDADGNHVWKATTTAPLQKADALQCESADGNLCQINGITVSEHYGTLGYGWKSYSSDVASCESGGKGQLHQFAAASITQNPQDSYLSPICGFSAPARIVYDLMSSKNNNYYIDTTGGKNHVRQIRLELDGIPSIDVPGSDVCWGRFNLPSDALLLHPSRKLYSVNTALNKIEILDLPDAATTDDKAPIAVIYSGKGTRHGLVKGPVAAAISPKGAILILESKNKRVQAFDTGMNPVKHFFHKTGYHFPLKAETETVYYTDMAMEYTGYIYILSHTASNVYRLDIYDKDGNFISRTTGVNAAKMTVDLWRNVYALNYEVLKMPDGTQPTITEPSVSEWIPSVP